MRLITSRVIQSGLEECKKRYEAHLSERLSFLHDLLFVWLFGASVTGTKALGLALDGVHGSFVLELLSHDGEVGSSFLGFCADLLLLVDRYSQEHCLVGLQPLLVLGGSACVGEVKDSELWALRDGLVLRDAQFDIGHVDPHTTSH